MKTWKSKEVIETLETLIQDIKEHGKKNVPVYITIMGEDKIYPVTTIGSNLNCIVISAHSDDLIVKEPKEFKTNSDVWIERVSK